MPHPQRLGEQVERDHREVPFSALQRADVLLADPRARRDLLLRQALLLSQASEIPTEESAHVHLQVMARHIF